MRSTPGLLTSIWIGIGTVSVAVAADPPAAQTTATSSASTAASTSNATSAAASTPSANQGMSADEEKKLISSGYKIEMKNGEKRYCRREAQMGTRFEHKVCSTAEELKARRQDDQDAVRQSQQMHQMNPRGN
jgi:hypothetical protein